jgi:hypothetical protein
MHNLRNHAVSVRAGCAAWGAWSLAAPASRQDDHRIVGVRAVQQHGVAQHLRDLAVGLVRDRLRGVVAIELGGLADLDLHELVIVERLLDGGDQAVIDPALADLNDGLQIMTETAEMTTLLASEHGGL